MKTNSELPYAVVVLRRLPGLEGDREGQTLEDGLPEEGLTALDHQVQTHALGSCALSKYRHLLQ